MLIGGLPSICLELFSAVTSTGVCTLYQACLIDCSSISPLRITVYARSEKADPEASHLFMQSVTGQQAE
jgi:hypothetical protein